MADAVYQALDRMVPALEDLQIRGIFDKDEIKAIVQKRRDFEFLLRRRTARKADFLRYIEYEMNLEELRRLRKERVGLKKSTISDHSGKQLIHFIYERALRKFRGDLELWLQYLDYCSQTKANRHHSRALAAALQIFPRQAGLWIRAASYEFFDNSNPTSARVLLQRGLRINPSTSRLLWVQYFRFELMYIEKLRGRREALGITAEDKAGKGKRKRRASSVSSEGGEEEGEEGVEVPRLPEEDEEEANAAEDHTRALSKEDPHEASVAAFFRGAVPRVVLSSARRAMPHDLDLLLQFLEVCREFPLTTEGEGGLVPKVLGAIEEEVGAEERVWAEAMHELRRERQEDEEEEEGEKAGAAGEKKAKKRRRSKQQQDEAALPTKQLSVEERGEDAAHRACLSVLEAGLERCQSEKMWGLFLQGVTELLSLPEEVVERCMASAHEQGRLPAKWYGPWSDLTDSPVEAKAVLERGLDKQGASSEEVQDLWRRMLAVKVVLKEVSGLDAVLDKALEGRPKDETAELWLEYVKGGSKGAWEKAVVRTGGAARVAVCEAWWEKEGGKAFDAMMKLVGRTPGLGSLCEQAIEREELEGADRTRLRAMYEAALSVCPDHPPLWERYEAMERSAGEHKKANAIKWRSERTAA